MIAISSTCVQSNYMSSCVSNKDWQIGVGFQGFPHLIPPTMTFFPPKNLI